MTLKSITSACAIVAIVLTSAYAGTPVEELIKQLGSTDFKQRSAATKALLELPEAERPLRTAMRSADPEVARRAAEIVAEIERRRSPFRILDDAIERGLMERAIEIMASWPEDKHEDDLIDRIHQLSCSLAERNNNMREREFVPTLRSWPGNPRSTFKGAAFTEADWGLRYHDGRFLLRTNRVSVIPSRKADFGTAGRLLGNACVIADGPVRLDEMSLYDGCMILANGDVEIGKGPRLRMLQRVIIVSAGNVTIEGHMIICLVIAKGAVTAPKSTLTQTRIVAGKSITVFKESHTDLSNVIKENDPNPLGYVRWSAPPDAKK